MIEVLKKFLLPTDYKTQNNEQKPTNLAHLLQTCCTESRPKYSRIIPHFWYLTLVTNTLTSPPNSRSHLAPLGEKKYPRNTHTPMTNTQGGFEGRSQIMNWITSEKLGSSLGRREDQIRRPMSYIGH